MSLFEVSTPGIFHHSFLDRKVTTDQRWKSILKTKFCTQKNFTLKTCPATKKTCSPHHLHQGTPTKLTKPFRLTSLMNCQRLEAYVGPNLSTQSLLVKKSMFWNGDFDAFLFQEPQMDFGLLRSWLRHPPLPKNNVQVSNFGNVS